MNENITEDILQCKSKELKGMYKCNILLQTPYAVHFIKKNVYKAPAPFPAAVYLYKSVTNTPLLINLQLHRKSNLDPSVSIIQKLPFPLQVASSCPGFLLHPVLRI